MKKLILAAAVIFTIAMSSCTKENVSSMHKATTIADKANLAQCDANAPIDPAAPCTPPTDGGH
jgi:hypothetical protein